MAEVSLQIQAGALLELKLRERRKELSKSFKAFITYFFPISEGCDFIFKEHHERIITKLEEVYRGECNRLIINIPPGYGKTELVVNLFSAWCFAKSPCCRFLHLSYTSDLVERNSVKIKELMKSDEFQEIWPTPFSPYVDGKGHWQTVAGEFKANSTGGAVTGFRAGRMSPGFTGAVLIDDPIKPEDAESDTVRKKMNERLNSTIKSRLMHESVPVVLIMQRLHDQDPTGFMMEGGTGDDFESLVIKATNKDEEGNEYAIWPEKDSLEYLQRFRDASPYVYSSQYDQNPVPDDGVFFQREQFNWYDPGEIPDGEDFGSSDYASTEGAGDYTEHGVFRVTPDNSIYVKDWWSGQRASDIWIETQIDLGVKHEINMWAGETGPIRNSIEPFLLRRMIERNKPMKLEWFSHAQASKEQNARGFQALVSSGRVYLPNNCPWAIELLEQLCRFPRARYDDKVDVCSIFAKMINKLWAESPAKEEDEKANGMSINAMISRNREKRRKQGRR